MEAWRPPRARTRGLSQVEIRALPVSEQSRVLREFLERHGEAFRAAFPDVESLSLGKRLQGRRVRTHSGLVLVVGVLRKKEQPRRPVPRRVLHPSVVREPGGRTARSTRAVVVIPTDVVERSRGKLTGYAANVFSNPGGNKYVRGCVAARVTLGTEFGWLTAAHVAHAIASTCQFRARARIGPLPFASGAAVLGTIPSRGRSWPIRDNEAPFRTDVAVIPEENAQAIGARWIAGKFRRSLPANKIVTGVSFYMIGQDGRRRALRFAQMQPDGLHVFELWAGRKEPFPRFAFFEGNVRPGDSGSPVFRISSGRRLFVGVVFANLEIGHVWGAAVWTFDDIRRAFKTDLGKTLDLSPLT